MKQVAILYVIYRSPYIFNIRYLFNFIKKEDIIMFIADGVISGVSGSLIESYLISINNKIYALKEDIILRGILNKFSNRIKIIGYTKFVKLTEKYKYMLW